MELATMRAFKRLFAYISGGNKNGVCVCVCVCVCVHACVCIHLFIYVLFDLLLKHVVSLKSTCLFHIFAHHWHTQYSASTLQTTAVF